MADVAERVFEILDSSTLRGDLRDALLDRLKTMPKPWTVLSEAEQAELIAGCDRVAMSLVTRAVCLIAANGFTALPGILEKVTVKDGMQVVVQLSRKDPHRHELIDTMGNSVMVVIAQADMFMGEQGPAKPDPRMTVDPSTGEVVTPFKPRE